MRPSAPHLSPHWVEEIASRGTSQGSNEHSRIGNQRALAYRNPPEAPKVGPERLVERIEQAREEEGSANSAA